MSGLPPTAADDGSPPLVLASRSARRAGLLRQAGYTFMQADPPFEDPPMPEAEAGQCPTELARELALQKAQSLRSAALPHNAVILAADTICVGPAGELLGQPQTRHQAKAMLRRFVGQRHDVVTGIAVMTSAGRCESLSDTAVVTWGAIDDATLEAYLRTNAWQGKAGGYNLFEREQAGWPITVQGDRTTVVGLPMPKVLDVLQRFGVKRTDGV